MPYHSILKIVISNLQITKTDIEILKLLISKKGDY